MPEYRLHHLHHESADVDAAAQWYQQNFDAELVERFERDGVQWARLRVAGVDFNLTDRASTEVELAPYRGLDHFALATDDLDATLAQLASHGTVPWLGPLSPRPGIRVAFVGGPDNVKIELLQID